MRWPGGAGSQAPCCSSSSSWCRCGPPSCLPTCTGEHCCCLAGKLAAQPAPALQSMPCTPRWPPPAAGPAQPALLTAPSARPPPHPPAAWVTPSTAASTAPCTASWARAGAASPGSSSSSTSSSSPWLTREPGCSLVSHRTAHFQLPCLWRLRRPAVPPHLPSAPLRTHSPPPPRPSSPYPAALPAASP